MIGSVFGLARRRSQRRPPPRVWPHLELLEARDVPHALALTPLVAVSGPSPFLGSPVEANDPPSTYNTEVEPYLAVDPTNPDHLVGAWIQDFARGIVAAVSFNGGNTWQSVVIPGVTQTAGGPYPRGSDPWVSFAPNGDVYVCLIGFELPPIENPNALLVSKSTDGGLTWGAPVTINTGDKNFQEKAAITADPTNSQFAYITWSVFDNSRGIGMFSRTTDGGQTWEPARTIFDPGTHNILEIPQIVVLPDGTLVNVFVLQTSTNTSGGIRHFDFEIALLRSSDHGQSWTTTPIPVSPILPLNDTISIPGARGVPNPDGGLGVVAPVWFFDVTVDPANGNLYAVWQDTRFNNFQDSSIAFSMSTDGGFTWSTPIRVNQTPDNVPAGNRQAFLPSVAVNQDGVVAVTYYDFRNNTPAAGLPTDYWIIHAHPSDGLTNPASWSSENRLTTASFNIENAPVNNGYFIGDYQGLVGQGRHFGAFFSMPSGSDRSSVFYRDPLPVETTADIGADDQQFEFHTASLELAFAGTLWPDANGSGWGWNVNAEPKSDNEFMRPSSQGEQHRIDLLTALEHEVGHLLGRGHEADGVMQETLTAGTRRTVSAVLPADADYLSVALAGSEWTEETPWIGGRRSGRGNKS